MERSLYVLPEPFRGESPTSWLFRIAEMHQTSVVELLSSLNIRSKLHGRRRDLDLSFHERFVRRIAAGTNVSLTDVDTMARHFEAFRRETWATRWLRKTAVGTPGIAYCPECFASDVVPYWRAVWRFRYWVVCPEHNCRLLAACPRCHSECSLEDGVGKVSSELLHRWRVCQGCGADRSGFKPPSECRRHHDGIRQVTDLQIAVTSALGHGYFSQSGRSGQAMRKQVTDNHRPTQR